MQAVVVTKDLIAQRNLTSDEFKRIVKILRRELICIGMDS